MPSSGQSEETRKLMAYLTKALNLPANLAWLELRIARDEVVQVKCEFFPEVTPPEQS